MFFDRPMDLGGSLLFFGVVSLPCFNFLCYNHGFTGIMYRIMSMSLLILVGYVIPMFMVWPTVLNTPAEASGPRIFFNLQVYSKNKKCTE